MSPAITIAPNRLSTNPSRTIRWIGNSPLPNTTALGAVATGSMKAQLALIAAGTMSHRGSISTANATAANTGISSAVVAVLEVASVKKVTTNANSNIIKKTGNAATKVNASPTWALSPDATKPLAKQIPPANNSNTSQGFDLLVANR